MPSCSAHVSRRRGGLAVIVLMQGSRSKRPDLRPSIAGAQALLTSAMMPTGDTFRFIIGSSLTRIFVASTCRNLARLACRKKPARRLSENRARSPKGSQSIKLPRFPSCSQVLAFDIRDRTEASFEFERTQQIMPKCMTCRRAWTGCMKSCRRAYDMPTSINRTHEIMPTCMKR